MNKLIPLFLIVCILAACKNKVATTTTPVAGNKDLAALFEKYYNDRMALLPVEATINGDSLYNDQLPAEFTYSYRQKLTSFFANNLQAVQQFNREQLNETDRTSYDIFKREMEMSIEGLKYQYFSTVDYTVDGHAPFNQFYGLPLSFGQMGSGAGAQPFNTVRDYDNWLKRAAAFPAWADSAIVYFKKGMAAGNVLPAKLVVKMITQMQNMVATDATKSLYYGPVKNIPASFPEADKKRLTAAFTPLIQNTLSPAFQKLADFLKTEAKTETVIGQSFQLGEFTCVPVIKFGVGLGYGAGEGKGDQNGKAKGEGTGGGAGGGVGVVPIGFLATRQDLISFIPAQTTKGMSAMFEKLPGLLEKFIDKKANEKATAAV